jgi:hypothetical protein
MPKISQYPAVIEVLATDELVCNQGGVTKKVTISTLKSAGGFSPYVKNNLNGSGAPGVGDDSADGYSIGSLWINVASSPKEAYQCMDATAGAAVWINTTLDISELGTGALRAIEAGTAENDMLFAAPSTFSWVRKTLAQAKTILGLGGSVPVPVAESDFIVATGSPLDWAIKTLAQVRALVGLEAATTKILVGGGEGNPPVWTEATGSGAPVRATSPTLVTPVLGTPVSGDLQNCTGLPLSGLAVGSAESDFIVAGASPFTFAIKTIADTKTLLHAAPGAIGETTPGTIRGLNKEIFKTENGTLTADECSGTIVSNYGMTDANCTIDLPTAAEGLAFICILPTVRAKFFKLHCPSAQSDKIYLLGVAGSDDGNVGVASGYATGASCSMFTFKTGDGVYDWFCIPIFGTWVAS